MSGASDTSSTRALRGCWAEGDIVANRFRITLVLNQDVGAVTYLAKDVRSSEPVVIRSIDKRLLPRGTMIRLEHEAQVLCKAQSDFASCLLHSGWEHGRFVMVYPYVRGRPLAVRLREGPLNLSEAVKVAVSLFSGLRDLHSNRVVHRSVRPSNIIVDETGPVTAAMLVDFGPPPMIYDTGQHESQRAEAALYVSPEQAGLINHDVGETSDLYSAGITLYHALAGAAPIQDGSLGEILYAHMTVTIPSLREKGVEVPAALDELIARLFTKDPRQRYQSAEAALTDLQLMIRAFDAGNFDPQIPIGAHDRRFTLTEPAFVSRVEELRRLDELLDRSERGDSGVVLLEGDSGSGKTWLLDEFCQRAGQAGVRVFRGRGTSAVAGQPLGVLQGVAADFASATSVDQVISESVRERIGQHSGIVARLLPRLADIFTPIPEERSGPADAGEQRTTEALCSFLESLGSRDHPAVVILDDCQWADDLMLKLIRRWRRNIDRIDASACHVLLVIAFRSEDVPAGHVLRHVSADAHLTLNPLSDDEIRRLTESMAGPLPESAHEVISRVANGSPYMASATVRGLVESAALVPGPGGWDVDTKKMEDAQSSEQAGAFLTQRLDRLPEDVLNVLSIGSILGSEFDIETAGHLAGQSISASIEAIDVARARHLVWCRPDGATFVFVHNDVRTSLRRRLSMAGRRALHRKAADYLRTTRPQASAEIAYHFDSAGEQSAALPYALLAAEDCAARSALETAEQQYRIAERGSEFCDPRTQFRISDGFGSVMMLRGRYDEAEELFRAAAETADTPLQLAAVRGKLAELSFKRGNMLQASVDYEAALTSCRRLVPRRCIFNILMLGWELLVQCLHTCLPRLFVHRSSEAPTEKARLELKLYSGLAHCCWYRQRFVLGQWAHLRSLNLAERYPPTRELAQLYSDHAPAVCLIGLFQRAEHYVTRSLSIRESFEDLNGQGQSLCYYACVLYAASRFDEAIERARDAIRILERTGDYWQVHIARYQLAASLYHVGDLHGALEAARANHRSGLATGDEQASGIVLDVWARCTDGAIPAEILNVELGRDRQDAQGQAQLMFTEALCKLHAGNTERAASIIEDAIRTIREEGMWNPYTLPLLVWAVTAARIRVESSSQLTPSRRRQLIQEADARCRRARWYAWLCRNDHPRLLREAALIAAMKGHDEKSQRLFDQSLTLARTQQARLEYALTLEARGRVGLEFGWLGAKKDARQAWVLLDELRQVGHSSDAGTRHETTHLSLADRFDTVLRTGRRIASALSPETVYEQTIVAAQRLLRADKALIVPINEDGPDADAGRELLRGTAETALLQHAITLQRAVALTDELFDVTGGDPSARRQSLLCVPLQVRGRSIACLCVANQLIPGLFGRDEEQLADFIATIAGAALENADGFAELQQLNETLEERVQERTAAAEAASEAKSRFLAAMSHEIRTPMNGIMGMTELTLATRLTDEQRRCLSIVKDSSSALLTLLNDVLDFSKVEAGKMSVDSIPFDLHETVVESIRPLAVNAAQKGLDVMTSITPDVPLMQIGDPNRLRQILVNLVGNAIKFTGTGFVKVSLSRSHTRDGERIHFEVMDTGIGISAEKQSEIFEAFNQGATSVTREFGGTGLGLAISSELVQLMGGQLTVESIVGHGATFRFSLPCRQLPTSRESQEPKSDSPFVGMLYLTNGFQDLVNGLQDDRKVPPSDDGNRSASADAMTEADPEQPENNAPGPPEDVRRVLVADDSPVNQEVAVGLLEIMGHEVTAVSSGQEAVDAALHEEYDVILLDLEMPGMDGFEAAQLIRQAESGTQRRQPIVAMTAHAMEGVRDRCLTAGMDDFVSKPVEPDHLKDVILRFPINVSCTTVT